MALGRAALEEGKDSGGFKQAAAEFEAAAELAPDWPEPRYGLGEAYAQLGDWDKAMENYEQYLKLSPHAKDAAKVKNKIYKIEYKMKEAQDDPNAGNNLLKTMVEIPAGKFQMGGEGNAPFPFGSSSGHEVWLDAYYIDKYLVTFEQYNADCEAEGVEKPVENLKSYALHYPVVNITWYDADAYCKRAGKRLPTEAEWEKAARGGTDTVWFWGNEEKPADQYAWYKKTTVEACQHPVGLLKPNPYGLYDMVGLVWEWCSDWYGIHYYDNSPRENPQGPATFVSADCVGKIIRGGCCAAKDNPLDDLRSANRKWMDVNSKDFLTGCRCAKSK